MTDAASLKDVYIVLCGREDEDGSYVDAEVERVYETRAVADEYIKEIEAASDLDPSRPVWWIEKWAVLPTLWDERVGDEVIESG